MKGIFTEETGIQYQGSRYPFPCVYDPLPASDAIFFQVNEQQRDECLAGIERKFIDILNWIHADAGRFPDLIYMHHASFNAIAMQRALATLDTSTPTFIHLHGTELSAAREYGEAARMALEQVTRNASLTAYISSDDRNRLLELVPQTDRSRLLYFPPWLNEKIFHPGRSAEEKQTEHSVVLIGRLAKWKRIEALILAAKHFTDRTDARVVIVGEGPDGQRLHELAAAQGMHSRIEFTGFIPHHKLGCLLRKSASVLVNTSAFEPFGMTIIEAMACGVPVIATNRGGPVDLINADTGCLVDDHGNIEDYAARLGETICKALVENWRVRKGPACIAAAKRFSIQSRRNEIEALLHAAIGAEVEAFPAHPDPSM
ncbi:glycosyltransferase [Streptomyces afghaniensis]|uniref:glycosyltransferase n=1 Tax=Streptomyces afghaniensis TaxID=66865 RepID=UPI00379C1F65